MNDKIYVIIIIIPAVEMSISKRLKYLTGLALNCFMFFKLNLIASNQVGHVQDIQFKAGMNHQLITKSLRPLLFGKQHVFIILSLSY